mmetsp:Transcript_23094/g.63776  ORF Transcript_23094/g.63776 Transcript_23094/m.63776 type:complete len:201 (-) Transcript_23094:317-919(-)
MPQTLPRAPVTPLSAPPLTSPSGQARPSSQSASSRRGLGSSLRHWWQKKAATSTMCTRLQPCCTLQSYCRELLQALPAIPPQAAAKATAPRTVHPIVRQLIAAVAPKLTPGLQTAMPGAHMLPWIPSAFSSSSSQCCKCLQSLHLGLVAPPPPSTWPNSPPECKPFCTPCCALCAGRCLPWMCRVCPTHCTRLQCCIFLT